MGPRERVWGYTGATGMVQGFSAGYFLWDLAISAKNLDVHGPGSLMHAASALAVTMLGFVRAPNCGIGRLMLMVIAALLQLLRCEFHTVRAFHTVPEFPLVHG